MGTLLRSSNSAFRIPHPKLTGIDAKARVADATCRMPGPPADPVDPMLSFARCLSPQSRCLLFAWQLYSIAAMTESRRKTDQVLDGIITAGAWLLAVMAPAFLAPPRGDVYTGEPYSGILLTTTLFVYVYRHYREATSGGSIQAGDLVAKVIIPCAIFLLVSWFAFA